MAIPVHSHLPFADRLTRQLARKIPKHVSRDDLLSAGREGLVEAAHRFRPDCGVPFAAFAAHRIRGAVRDELRALDVVSRAARLRLREGGQREGWEPIFEQDAVLSDVADGAPRADETVAHNEMLQALRRAYRRLPDRLQLILRLYYVDELTMREIGARLGVTEARVCQVHAGAMARLRKAILAAQALSAP